jgi:hypothetical protein
MAKQVRPLPYERRAKKAGAGIVKPGGTPPVSAWKWPKWKLSEAAKAGQAEMFGGADLGEHPDRIAERENRRLRRASGGSSTTRLRFEKKE